VEIVNGPAVSVLASNVVCTTMRGGEDPTPDMNKEQLDSLGCRRYSVQFEASTDLNFMVDDTARKGPIRIKVRTTDSVLSNWVDRPYL
jgi:hypothetical protein